ncbi:P-loop containing nucleoside triphosphate hydrolase protein [Russula earlei]|uniref:P-loop containing nucleoside triphosphate hydrolase protein n=1 Tax=Russula earlei TaxID=71964 RepID=A0ACC0TZ25_9AGAM|nr:P-loop containing nucleoside triphosphate hydrolase protein [Russula earlei]
MAEGGYANRALRSIPSPPEPDSDPEFTAGAIINTDEPLRKTRKFRSDERSLSPRQVKRTRRSEFWSDRNTNAQRKRNHKSLSQNPLLEIFSRREGLGLEIDTSDEDSEQPSNDEHVRLEPAEDNASSNDSQSESSSPLLSKSAISVGVVPAKRRDHSLGEDSVTEPESDGEHLEAQSKRKASEMEFKIPPAKRPGTTEGSVTESESDSDVVLPSRLPPSASCLASKKGALYRSSPANDSVTESESDDGLPVEAEQPHLDPLLDSVLSTPADALVLDAKHHIRVPPSLSKCLRLYQREGVQFLFQRYILGRGAVLGDDMGLGKTIQVISFLSALMRKSGTPSDRERRRNRVSQLQDGREWHDGRKLPPPDDKWPTALIITPSSVVNVWTREFAKWGYFEVGAYIGTQGERERVLNDFILGRLDVVVTSFDTARRSIMLLDNLPWTVLIVDEAHRLKNPKANTTRALASFHWPDTHTIPSHVTELTPASEFQASTSHALWAQPTAAIPRTGPIRIALTGTAIQNSYMELWTLLDWVNPGSVGTEKQWKKTVANPLAAGQAKGCKEEERLRASGIAEILRNKLLPLYFLRRTKNIIKDQLTKKYDEVVFCPLTESQIEVYKRILGMEAVQNMIRKDERCECGKGKKRKECCHPFAAGDLFKYMSALIKVSNHLLLMLPAHTDTPEQRARNRELTEVAFPNGPIPKYGSAILEPAFCGKWIVLETLLREWRRDPANKVLIFTKSVKLLDVLEYHVRRHHYGFVKLDGSTKQEDRMPLIDRFQHEAEIFIFLISTLAGGTGLNLTAANRVVIFDPNWNPAHDLQAMDRAYRFGQTRDVFVYRLLGAGSIEELIYARQVYKQQQMAIGYNASVQTRYFAGISGDKKRQGELFGLKNIFALHEDTGSTRMAIEHANIVNLDWALAHMDGVKSKKTRRKSGTAEDWVYEAEMKDAVEDADLKGLGALLLDDSVPEVMGDTVSKILESRGIKYSHRNDDILVPNTIEEQRMKKARKERRQREKKANEREALVGHELEWPPKRKHHKPPPSPRTKLRQRQKALMELGMIQSPDDLPAFAQNFAVKTAEEQTELLAKLDTHAAPRTR